MMNRERIRSYISSGMSTSQIVKMAEQEASDEGYAKGYTKGMRDCLDTIYYMTAYTAELEFDLFEDNEKLKKFMKRLYDNVVSFATGQLYPEDFDVIRKEMQEKGIKMVD